MIEAGKDSLLHIYSVYNYDEELQVCGSICVSYVKNEQFFDKYKIGIAIL